VARGPSFVELAAGVALLVAGLIAAPGAERALATGRDLAADVDAAYQSAYSLDLADALTSARRVVLSSPKVSRAQRALATMVCTVIPFQRHAQQQIG